MTTDEFSAEFDVLLGVELRGKNYGVAQNTIELDEYEKSIFLTEAQEDIVKAIYSGTLDGNPYESTEETRRILNHLIKSKEIDVVTTSTASLYEYPVQLEKDTWYIIKEVAKVEDSTLTCGNIKWVAVVPIRQDEYLRIIENPFKSATNRRVLRLDDANLNTLVSKYKLSKYQYTYISEPEPIILANNLSTSNLTVNGSAIKTTCKLNDSIHRTILKRAVQLAIQRIGSQQSK